jgi:transcriptional regulatory protein LevR
MDDMLMVRLNLLVDSGEITETIRYSVVDFVNGIEDKYSLKITEENGSMLVSHLAMALGRIERREEIQTMDEELFTEVKETQTYKELDMFYDILEENLGSEIPESEKDFIALHLCTLIENVYRRR